MNLNSMQFNGLTTADLGKRCIYIGESTFVSVGTASDGVSNTCAFGDPNGAIGLACNPGDATFTLAAKVKGSGFNFGVSDFISGITHIHIVGNGNGSVSILRINANNNLLSTAFATELGTSDAGILGSGFNFIVLKGKLANGTGGNVAARVNGALRINNPSCDTLNSWSGSPARWNVGFFGSAGSFYEYVRCQDQLGSHNNGWINDQVVEFQRVNGAGNYSEWTPDPTVANYLNVDDTTPDGDTTRVFTNIINNRDLYTKPNLTKIASNITLAQIIHIAKKSENGTRAIAALLRKGGVDYLSGLDQYLSTDYSGWVTPYEEDPATGVPHTVAGWDASEIGQQVTV